jgi:hypothetical protein
VSEREVMDGAETAEILDVGAKLYSNALDHRIRAWGTLATAYYGRDRDGNLTCGVVYERFDETGHRERYEEWTAYGFDNLYEVTVAGEWLPA